jgi:hypothetical protein
MRANSTTVLVCLAAACGGPTYKEVPSFELTAPGLPLPESSGEAQGSSSGAGSTGSTGMVEDSTAGGSSGGLLRDVGSGMDLGPPGPQGCQGKIDFLFLVSSEFVMQTIQQRMLDAFTDFYSTIEAKFADVDFHIMVVDGDVMWGNETCNEECNPNGCPFPDYPCGQLGTITECDNTLGAGVIFNAGENAPNVRCDVAGGRRFLTNEQPDLEETFACMAQVGTSGASLLGAELVGVMSPELNGPGGCNEGFIRDDALLMVTFVMGGHDWLSKGKAEEWAQAVLDAKHGDPNSVVMFGLFAPNCPEDKDDRLCQMVTMFPFWQVESNLVEDYGPAFDQATEMIGEACSQFIPQ